MEREILLIKLWKNFVDITTAEIIESAGDCKKIEVVKRKIVDYVTYVLGLEGIKNHLVIDVEDAKKHKENLIKELDYSYRNVDFTQFFNNFCCYLEEYMIRYKDITSSIRKDKKLTVIKRSVVTFVYKEKEKKLDKNIYNKLIQLSKTEDTDRNIYLLLTRYDYLLTAMNGLCYSATSVYKFLENREYFNKELTLEAFANPFNCNITNYCSLFSDLESNFGSKGSFFLQDLSIYNLVICNPPFLTNVMQKSEGIFLDYLSLDDKKLLLIFPDWRSEKEVENDKNKDYTFLNKGTNPKTKFKREIIPFDGYNLFNNSEKIRRVYTYEKFPFFDFFDNRVVEVKRIIVVLLTSDNCELWREGTDSLKEMDDFFSKYL